MTAPKIEYYSDVPIYVCVDCGASTTGELDTLKHHPTCTPGESEKWKNHYNKPFKLHANHPILKRIDEDVHYSELDARIEELQAAGYEVTVEEE